MGGILKDLRYGFRMLWKRPAFTIVAVITLALGIGANSAIFSGVSAFMLRPMPVEDPDRLVRVFEVQQSSPNDYDDFSYPDFVDYRDQNQSFEGLLSYTLAQAALSTSDQNDVIYGELVSGNYFDVLRVRPALGRGFLPEEDKTPGSHPVVVLSHSIWQRRFASDPGITGKTIMLNGQAFTVVGVAPESFKGTKWALSMDFWVPMMMQQQIQRADNQLDSRGSHWMDLLGRLKPGVTAEQAATELTAIARRLEQAYPSERAKDVRVLVMRETEGRFEDAAGMVTLSAGLALGAVGMILLIACANVANLLLARAVTRRKEIGIRLALGASRARLIRQLLTESVLLSVMGGILGLLIAFWATDLMQGFLPVLPYTFAFSFAPDARALIFSAIISLLTGIIFGLAPALQASNPDVVPVLKGETPVVKGGSRRFNLRNGLVVFQFALSLVVLVCGGLFVRSMRHAQSIDPGFTTKNTVAMSLNPGLLGYTDAQSRQFYQQLTERVRALPGVQAASIVEWLPLGDSSNSRGPLLKEGEPEPEPGKERGGSFINVVGQKYFETLQIPLLDGRDFDGRDREDTTPVIIVNETLARRLWPGESAIGKRFRIGRTGSPFREVVGVAKDGKYRMLGENPRSMMYLPHSQDPESGMMLMVRTANDARSIVSSVRVEVRSLDQMLPVHDVKTIEEHMSYPLMWVRMGATLATAFGLLALALAATGIYSVIAYSVTQRTKEIGIRMALGAERRDVLKMIASQGMALAVFGMVAGLVLAFVLTRILSSLLYGVGATDFVTFTVVSSLLLVVALLACYIPARRATKIDPIKALRHE
jgi:macrolide transport system ATP-binding/permease protein